MRFPDIRKVIIIGSGPAAHTAAIYTSRANLRPLMFEGFMAGGVAAGGALTQTTEIENFPGFPESVGGIEFTEKLRKQSLKFGTEIVSETVSKVDFSKRPFRVWTEEDHNNAEATAAAESVIIATGASANRLSIPGGDEYWNRGISACAVCDGALPIFRKKTVVVVGGGDSAAEEALFMSKYASKVYLVHRRDKLRASKIMVQRVMENAKIEVIWDTVIKEAKGDGDLLKSLIIENVKTGEQSELETSGLFYAIGHTPMTKIFAGQIDMDKDGYIITHNTRTNLPGVFAAGDCQDKVYRQAVTAAGTGCVAALEVEKYLLENPL
jgi:thioredoxin reductase (NADPH)